MMHSSFVHILVLSQNELLLRCIYLSLTGTVDMKDLKVALFGYGIVGKTALITRFVTVCLLAKLFSSVFLSFHLFIGICTSIFMLICSVQRISNVSRSQAGS